ncbi:MAG: ATP-binding protein [Pseudomonadota bacterium]
MNISQFLDGAVVCVALAGTLYVLRHAVPKPRLHHMVLAGALLTMGGLTAVHLISGIASAHAWVPSLATLFCTAVFIILAHRLQQGSRLQMAVLQQIPEPCLVLSPENRIVVANQPFLHLVGRDDVDVIGQSPDDIWHESGPIPQPSEFADHPNVDTYIEKELADGRFFKIRVSPLSIDDHTVGQLLSYSDITEYKSSSRSLIHDRQRLQQAHDVARIGYFTVDIETSEVVFSKGLEALLNIRPLGFDDFLRAIHPDDRALVTDLSAATADQKSLGRLIRLNHPDGWTMHLRLQVEWEQTNTNRLIAVVQDITAAVHSEQKENWSQKMTALGEMTGGIAHDFNNLLQVILGNTEMVRKHSGDNIKAHLDAITRAGERGSNLTQRLLAFAKKQILEPKIININACVRNLEPKLSSVVSEDIDVQISLHEPLPPCRIDPTHLEDMLMNLTMNARQSMDKGGTLTFTSRVIDGNQVDELGAGDYIHLSVTDTGRGMTADVKDRVFEPFFTTRDVGKGVGLGLSSAYGFVSQSGGFLTLQSEPTTGTTVSIYLPVHSQRPDHAAGNDIPLSGIALVIEDDPGVNELSVRFLETMGFSVRAAHTEDEAVRIIEETPNISIIVCDVMLQQERRGPELIHDIWPDGTHTPLIYMSGYTEDGIELQKNERFLSKPFSLRDMTAVVQDALGEEVRQSGKNTSSGGSSNH